MDTLVKDLRHASRTHLKSPLTAAVIACILAVGIGANATVFHLVNAMMLRPIPYEDPEELVALHEVQKKRGTDWNQISPLHLADWKRESRCFQAVAAYSRATFNLSTEEEPERVAGARVGAGLFPMLGVEPVLGRTFTVEEDRPGRGHVALLGHDLWQRRFGADPQVLGRTFQLDGETYKVVGVMPPRFGFPEWAELWTPLALDPQAFRRDDRWLDAFARLSPGFTPGQAQAEMDTIGRRLEERHAATDRGWGIRVRPLRDEMVPREARAGLLLMLGAVGFVLLIVCANVATLLLTKASGRLKEQAIRVALGASRLAIVRQSLMESLLLAILGGVLGVIVSLLGVQLMLRAVPVQIPFWVHFDLDARVLLFTFLVSLAAGLVFGLVPTLRSLAADPFVALKEEGRSASSGPRSNRLRSALVVAELALSLVLLVGAMLLVRSLHELRRADRGFASDNVLTLRFSLNGREHRDPAARSALIERLLARVEELPGVESVGVTTYLPISRDGYEPVAVVAEGVPVQDGEEAAASRHRTSAGYLETLGIRLLRGRMLTPREAAEGEPVALISESLATRLWPGDEPLGLRLQTLDSPAGEWLTVVGVTADVLQAYRMGGIDAWPDAQIYTSFSRAPEGAFTLVVKTTGDPLAMVAPVRAAVAEVAPHTPVYNVLTMPQVLQQVEWLPRFWGQMFAVFAVIALVIASLGLYGVTAFSVSQRVQEIGIRMALGANRRHVLRLVVGQSMRIVLIGLVVGLGGALALGRLMSSLLYGINAVDPLVLLTVSTVLATAAFFASLLPALRATRIHPGVALSS